MTHIKYQLLQTLEWDKICVFQTWIPSNTTRNYTIIYVNEVLDLVGMSGLEQT